MVANRVLQGVVVPPICLIQLIPILPEAHAPQIVYGGPSFTGTLFSSKLHAVHFRLWFEHCLRQMVQQSVEHFVRCMAIDAVQLKA